MFLVMLTQFVPISRQVPRIVMLFLSLTVVLRIVSGMVTLIEWGLDKAMDNKKEQEEFKTKLKEMRKTSNIIDDP